MFLELTHPTDFSGGRGSCLEGDKDVVYGGSNTQGEPSPSGVANNLLESGFRVSFHERMIEYNIHMWTIIGKFAATCTYTHTCQDHYR